MGRFLKRMDPRRMSLLHVGFDSALIFISLYFSLWLRLGFEDLADHLHTLNQLAVGFVLIRVLVMMGFGVYQSLWRYISNTDAIRLGAAVFVSVPLMISLTYGFKDFGYMPRSFFIIDALVCTALLMLVRLARRRLFEWQMQPKKGHVTLGKLIIYGAGQTGRLIAQRLLSDPQRDRDLLGFMDDNREVRDRHINGLPVLGDRRELENILSRSECTDLVVTVANPPADLMRELVLICRKLNIKIHRIGAGDTEFRPVELKDLLNRPTSEIDLPKLSELVRDQVVLVTGAGGSIGSELARQIHRLHPRKLLLLDHSEFNLFEIDRELRPKTEDFSLVLPLLMDIKDKNTLKSMFEKYQPRLVFHAAAYKHVHLVEANAPSAILNNVLGTKNLLELCQEFSVERFVMISTDKAVNPVGAMGASKRLCEILTSRAGLAKGRLYSSVRFGNVLGSSGSLIPLLQKQIVSGGPVTLTHQDMTRYFMLIPEAVSLVLMSATLSQPGDINVLKMGSPIRILDLAKSLMALMGRNEDEVGIVFTGVRPGEKMYEELYITGKELATRHPDILTVPRGDATAGFDGFDWTAQIDQLIRLAQTADPNTAKLLHELIRTEAKTSETATV